MVADLGRLHGNGWEIVVADDGSSDGTADVVAAMSRDDPRIVVLPGDHNRGKGDALARGFRAATGDVVVFLDADLPVPLDCLGLMIERAATADLVVGSRRIAGATFVVPQPRLRRWGGAAFLSVVRAMGFRVGSDPQCGVKVLRREPLRAIVDDVVSTGFAFDVELLSRARSAGATVVEHPVVWIHTDGSWVRPLHHAVGTVRELLALRRSMAAERRDRPDTGT